MGIMILLILQQRMFSLPERKPIYQMHYKPKLTSQLLADSDITEKESPSDEASECGHDDSESRTRYQQIVSKWGNKLASQKEGPRESHCGQLESEVERISTRIRIGVQHFVVAIGSEEPMTASLEFAIENLLLEMLHIANTLPSLLKSKVIPKKNQERNSCNQRESLDSSSHIKIEQNEDLPMLYELTIAEESSSAYSSSLHQSIREEQQNSESGKANFTIEKLLYDRCTGPSQGNRHCDLYQRYRERQPSGQYLPQQTKIISGRSMAHQSQLDPSQELDQEIESQIGSEIGIEEPSSVSMVSQHLTNTKYHSASQRFMETEFRQPLLQKNNVSACKRGQEKEQMDYSISEYYIESSPSDIGKSNKENRWAGFNLQTQNNGLANQIRTGKSKIVQNALNNGQMIPELAYGEGYVYSQVLSRRKIF